MRNVRMTFCLTAAVVFYVACQASAMVFDNFNNGLLDPAWNISFQNANGWTYMESGTKLSVYDIGVIGSPAYGKVFLKQDFLAPGDFEIKSGFSWDSESDYKTMQSLRISAYSGDTEVADGGYDDGWIARYGEKFADIENSFYTYGSGGGTLPNSGTAEITLKRTSGSINILWNDQVILTGYSDLAVDKVSMAFVTYPYTGAHFGVVSVDYINAVPEPATLLLLGLGAVFLKKPKNTKPN